MAHNAKIKVTNQLNYSVGGFVRKINNKEEVFIVVELNKHFIDSENTWSFKPSEEYHVCMPIDGFGTPVNLEINDLEAFKGVVTITV